MPITVEIVDNSATDKSLQQVFNYFRQIDKIFSTYKKDSEISKINRREIDKKDYTLEVREVLTLSEKTKKQTNGYFNIWHNGYLDPSGLVKGLAIWNASKNLKKYGFKNFYIDAGGDVQVYGLNSQNKKWRVGIKNPFNQREIIKVLSLTNQAIATSGTYIRGEHIYNPITNVEQKEIVSLSVIAQNIYDADRFTTAAFAMGRRGIEFISSKKNLEGYMIDKDGTATFTNGFEKFVC